MKKAVSQLLRRFGIAKVTTPNTVTSQSDGLHILYETESGHATVDIIAIHGMGAHWLNSWTDRNTGVCWLRDLLPQDIRADTRIISYGYDTTVLQIETFAHNLLQKVEALQRESHTPIVFLAHSLGGIILKAALAISYLRGEGNYFKDTPVRVFFFGLPRDWLQISRKLLARNQAIESPFLESTRKDVALFDLTESDFAELERSTLKCQYFEESYTSLPDEDLTNEELIQLLSTVHIRINRGHGPMTRYSSREDLEYRKVSFCIAGAIEQMRESH